MSSTGQDLRQITDCSSGIYCPIGAGPGMWQSWSPDGRWIVYAANSGKDPGGIYAVNAGGTDMRKLVSMPEDAIADWSPDGTEIVFDHSEQIYLAPLSGGAPALLVDNGDSPMWSPDGRWIAFTRWSAGSGGQGSIWLVHPDGSDLHRVADGLWSAGWSSDGSQLAILQGQGPSEAGSAIRHYAIVDVGTGDVQTIDIDAADTARLLFRWPGNS